MVPHDGLAWVEMNEADQRYWGRDICGPDVTWGGLHVSMAEYIRRGIRGFAAYGLKRVCVTTSNLSQAGLIYDDLRAYCKRLGVRLIGGLKARVFFAGTEIGHYDLEDAAKWLALRDAAEQVAMMTGEDLVIIDSETALSAWHREKQEFDLSRIAAAVSQLDDSPVRFVWYLPTVTNVARPASQQQAMVRAWDLRDSIFMTGMRTGRPSYLRDQSKAPYVDLMEHTVPQDRLWYFYYMDATADAWAVMPACHHARKEDLTMLMYPGLCKWGERGREAWRESRR